MRIQKSHGLVELGELDLALVSGGFKPPFDMDFRTPEKRGEVHGSFSGPPMKGEFGGSYAMPGGGTIGGSISSDGRDWVAGISGAMTSRSGSTVLSGSAHTNGHDWQVNGALVIRF